MRVIYPENVRAISPPLPSFPAEAKALIYGVEIRVLVDIDAQGKVKAALPHWPLVPCSNLADPRNRDQKSGTCGCKSVGV